MELIQKTAIYLGMFLLSENENFINKYIRFLSIQYSFVN